MRRSALIPAFNEAGTIQSVLHGLRVSMPDLHVLVIDDGSQDATFDVARSEGAEVLRRDNGGYASALLAGYRLLIDRGVDQVLQMDADGQHPVSESRRMFESLSEANWVVGSREGSKSPGAWTRKLGNAALSRVVNQVADLQLRDVTSGFWALDRKALAVFAERFPGDVADANVRILGARAGLIIREIPVEMECREVGESMHDGWAGISNLGRTVRAVWRESRVY